jgi:hypothetical protein
MSKKKLINARELSRRITGSDHKLRHDGRIKDVIIECEELIESIVKKYALTKSQEKLNKKIVQS